MSDNKRFKYEENVALASQVFEQSLEGIMITDKDNNIIMVNNAFEKMTGFLLEEIKGKKANILKSGINNDKFYANLWRR